MSQLRRINSLPDPICKQLASVRRTEMIELKNRRRELLDQVEAEAVENASLKSVRAKFDTAITRHTGAKSDFALTCESHRKEMQQQRNEVRSNNRRCQKYDQKIRAAEEELQEMKDLLRRYRELIDKERLEGAETLADRLRQNEERIGERDLEIQNLRTEVESLTLSQQEEIRSEKLQNRQANKSFHELKKELEATVTRLKEKSKEIDLRNIHHFRKASNSVVTLPSKLEKPNPRTLASQRNSDTYLSARQRAKLYAINRQARLRRVRKGRQKHQQSTETVTGSCSAELTRQQHPEEESALLQARQRKQVPREEDEEELYKALELERWKRAGKHAEEKTQRMKRQQQLEEMGKSVSVESKDHESHLEESRNVGTGDVGNEAKEAWMRSEYAYSPSLDEEIEQHFVEFDKRRLNERRRESVEKRSLLLEVEEVVKTRPIEENGRAEERKRGGEEDIEGKRVEEGDGLEGEGQNFEDDSKWMKRQGRTFRKNRLLIKEEVKEDSKELRENGLLIKEEIREDNKELKKDRVLIKEEIRKDNKEHHNHQAQPNDLPNDLQNDLPNDLQNDLPNDLPIKALFADIHSRVDATRSADVETKKKRMKSKKDYTFTRSTRHLHEGHPTHKMKFIWWGHGQRHGNENPQKDSS